MTLELAGALVIGLRALALAEPATVTESQPTSASALGHPTAVSASLHAQLDNAKTSLQAVTEKLKSLRRDSELYDILMSGRDISSTLAGDLERKLASDPQDLDSRLRLLGYRGRTIFFEATLEDREKKIKGITELISRHPDLPANIWRSNWAIGAGREDGPAAIREYLGAWETHLAAHPTSTSYLEHAALFIENIDRPKSLQYLERARTMTPADPLWSRNLGMSRLMLARTQDPELQYTQASLALRDLEQALVKTQTESSRLWLYEYAAQAAWLVDRNDKASDWAKLMLKNSSVSDLSYVRTLHEANTILGLIAMDRRDRAAARQYLMASVDFNRSDPINDSVPSMILAASLLDAGERDVVLEYLESVKSKWSADIVGNIDSKMAIIRTGGIPDEFTYDLKKLSGRKKTAKH